MSDINYKDILQIEFPYLSDVSAQLIVDYITEIICDVLQVDDIPVEAEKRAMLAMIETVQQSGMTSFESYGENGISATLDKQYVTKYFVPKVRNIMYRKSSTESEVQ